MKLSDQNGERLVDRMANSCRHARELAQSVGWTGLGRVGAARRRYRCFDELLGTLTLSSTSTYVVLAISYHCGYKIQLTPSTPAVPNCYCLKRSAPYWSNPPVLIFDIRVLWRSVLSARAPECQKSKLVG